MDEFKIFDLIVFSEFEMQRQKFSVADDTMSISLFFKNQRIGATVQDLRRINLDSPIVRHFSLFSMTPLLFIT
jgi:hypothetical protein